MYKSSNMVQCKAQQDIPIHFTGNLNLLHQLFPGGISFTELSSDHIHGNSLLHIQWIIFHNVLTCQDPPLIITYILVYVQEHFLEVIQNQEFLLLPGPEIVKLLSSDDINVPDEETIFQALMMWVRHDVPARQKELGLLLSFIRLPLLPPQVCV